MKYCNCTMKINEILRRVRESKELTQQNLADELGVDVTTVNRWESEEGTIKNKMLEQIAKVYNLTVSQIYSYQDNPSLLQEPISVYAKTKRKVSVLMEIDGTATTLEECFLMLKKLNAAI